MPSLSRPDPAVAESRDQGPPEGSTPPLARGVSEEIPRPPALVVRRYRYPRLVSIEDVEDGCVAWGDPDVVGIYLRDGRRVTWADLPDA